MTYYVSSGTLNSTNSTQFNSTPIVVTWSERRWWWWWWRWCYLNAESLDVVGAVSAAREVRQVELDLVPTFVESHRHRADERLDARRALIIAGAESSTYVLVVQYLYAYNKNPHTHIYTNTRPHNTTQVDHTAVLTSHNEQRRMSTLFGCQTQLHTEQVVWLPSGAGPTRYFPARVQ